MISKIVLTLAAVSSAVLLCVSTAFAQEEYQTPDIQGLLQEVRWKSEAQVRERLGDPQSIRGPIGTHATYQLWNYEGFSVAIANNRVFHIFDKNSLHKLQLEENR